jgi:hypothetical protein
VTVAGDWRDPERCATATKLLGALTLWPLPWTLRKHVSVSKEKSTSFGKEFCFQRDLKRFEQNF